MPKKTDRREAENDKKGGGREGVGEASFFLGNKIKRKRLFYTQVRSCGRGLPARVCVRVCVSLSKTEKG